MTNPKNTKLEQKLSITNLVEMQGPGALIEFLASGPDPEIQTLEDLINLTDYYSQTKLVANSYERENPVSKTNNDVNCNKSTLLSAYPAMALPKYKFVFDKLSDDKSLAVFCNDVKVWRENVDSNVRGYYTNSISKFTAFILGLTVKKNLYVDCSSGVYVAITSEFVLPPDSFISQCKFRQVISNNELVKSFNVFDENFKAESEEETHKMIALYGDSIKMIAKLLNTKKNLAEVYKIETRTDALRGLTGILMQYREDSVTPVVLGIATGMGLPRRNKEALDSYLLKFSTEDREKIRSMLPKNDH
jgi:hypothetical protein